MSKEKENAADDFLDEHPEGCEVSFNYGWEAAMQEHKKRAIRKAIAEKGGASGPANSRWNPEITKKYEEAKVLVAQGSTRLAASRAVGLPYDSYMRRQRMEEKGQEPYRGDPEITRKYEEAKSLIGKGYTRAEACRKVDLIYDSFIRRQRMEVKAILEGEK